MRHCILLSRRRTGHPHIRDISLAREILQRHSGAMILAVSSQTIFLKRSTLQSVKRSYVRLATQRTVGLPNLLPSNALFPSCVTYRRQSEPIVVRIPQPDSQLIVQLHGQDLSFDPPVLSFAKSAEASFRITGTGLGQKTMVIACTGSNAPNYADCL